MTKREAKAVELYRKVPKVVLDWHGDKETDEQLLQRPYCQMILKGMNWIAEECVLASAGLKGDQQMIAIRNAGREDV